MKPHSREFHHPLVIRITHWIHVIAFTIMVTSGLRVYNASPLWNFDIPDVLTLGGWLAGARMWHFFGMWLFFVNGTVWLMYNIVSRHGRETTIFQRTDIRGIVPMVQYYLRLRKKHPPTRKYNPLQKLAYTTIPFAAIGMVLSGLSLYWPVQLSGLARLFGGYDTARIWHFLLMVSLVFFLFGHIVMVFVAGWWNFVSMITGWKRIPPHTVEKPIAPPLASPPQPENG